MYFCRESSRNKFYEINLYLNSFESIKICPKKSDSIHVIHTNDFNSYHKSKNRTKVLGFSVVENLG
jgi:hypothetical protein